MKRYLFILFTILCTVQLNAGNYYVETTGNDGNSGLSKDDAFLTVNRAFRSLADGDSVLIGEGVFTLTRTLEWDVALVIQGAGADKTIVQASEEQYMDAEDIFTFSVFYNQEPFNCTGNVPESVIEGICIRNGAAPIEEPVPTRLGGGIKNFAGLTVRDCKLENNSALNGGAIYNDGALVLENTVVQNNHAYNLHGAVFNTASAVYTDINNTFDSNTEDYTDQGIYILQDFEKGFSGAFGTNGNNEGGLVEDSPNFSIVTNPDKTGINYSENAGKFIRDNDGNWWAYAWFEFPEVNIIDTPKYLHIMVHKPIQSKVCVQLKNGHVPTDGNNTGEMISSDQTKTDEWEDLVYEISVPGAYTYMEIKPDFENATTSERLSSDIVIYFDDIIINDDPEPRTAPEQRLFTYDLPRGTAGVTPLDTIFAPRSIRGSVVPSRLEYTDNLLFDYNYSNGYFRPYGWPEGVVDENKYLQFSIDPGENDFLGVTRVVLQQKANTETLGPRKVRVSISHDNATTFEPVTDITLRRTEFGQDEILLNAIKTEDPVIFRLYGFESMLGLETQKDLWILDYIDVYGRVPDAVPPADKRLAVFNLPLGTQGETTLDELFSPELIADSIYVSNLGYTDNLLFDYNYSKGFFRPYGWPEEGYDPERYIEFSVAPEENTLLTLDEIQIDHKANTSILGPGKVHVSMSDDRGETFTDVADITPERTTFSTDKILLEDLTVEDTLLFRFYAHESLWGTTDQKDLWIINEIVLSGSIKGAVVGVKEHNSPEPDVLCYLAGGHIFIRNVQSGKKLELFDITGRKFAEHSLDGDEVIPAGSDQHIIIARIINGGAQKVFKLVNF